jgi:hypothetical protein
MVESEPAMNNPDPLNVRPHDPLTKWKREAEEQAEVAERTRRVEEAERRRREERQQTQQHDEVAALRAELQAEIENLRTRLDVFIEVLTEKMVEAGDRILDRTDEKVRETKSELFSLVEQRFGRLEGQIAGALGERRFKRFANETVEPDELPNWRKPTTTTH